MSVRAKFKCESNSEGQIRLRPVYDSNPESENGRFYKLTPAGQIDLTTVNEAAAKEFEVGKEYYADFSPAN